MMYTMMPQQQARFSRTRRMRYAVRRCSCWQQAPAPRYAYAPSAYNVVAVV